MPDAVIIGAGYAGMSAAALLSHAGWKVIVLEESEIVGGRADRFGMKKDIFGNTGRIRTGLRTRASPTRCSEDWEKKSIFCPRHMTAN